MARHKAPSALSRATQRFTPDLSGSRLRRTSGTVLALGSVVLAGAASTGSVDDDAAGSMAAIQLPTSVDAETQRTERRAQLGEASRDQARVDRAELRDHRDAPSADRTGSRTAEAESLVPEDPREIAQTMMAEYGWDSTQFSCLDQLYVSESNWDIDAENPSSGAYGIPQALPAEKMASAGGDWRTNPATQIEWGLWYIDQSYGTPCSAWEFKQANNWY